MKQLLRYMLSTLLIAAAVFVAVTYLMLGPDEMMDARADMKNFLNFKTEPTQLSQPAQKARANRSKQPTAQAKRKESGSSAIPKRHVGRSAILDKQEALPAIPKRPEAWPAILDTQEASATIPDRHEAKQAVPNGYEAAPAVTKKSLTQPEVQAPAVTNGNKQDPDTVLRLAPAESPPAQTPTLPPCVPGCGLPGTGLLTNTPLIPTVLYSFPGSGVVAFKRLLTTATQVVTGTIYERTEQDIYLNDKRLYRVLLGRTNLIPKETKRHVVWERTVLFIRNPYEAMVMQFIRDELSDDDSPLDTPRKTPSGWSKYVDEQTAIFKEMYVAWAKDKNPKHFVIYDRLVSNVGRELNSTLEFLREPLDSGINPIVHCAEADAQEILPATAVPWWLSRKLTFEGKRVTALNNAIDAVRAVVEASAKAKFPEFERWKRVV